MESADTGAPAAMTTGRSRAGWIVAGIVAVVFVGVTAALFLFAEHRNKAVVPEFRKVTNIGDCYYGVISPDGTSCAFSRRSRRKFTVEVCDIESGHAVTVFEGRYAQSICWSPDSRELLIRGQGVTDSVSPAVYLVPRFGGAVRRFETPGSPDYYWDIAWYPDGSKFVAVADHERLIYTDKITGDTTVVPLSVPFSDMAIGGFSPDGRWLSVFGAVGNEYGVWLVSADGKTANRISKDLHVQMTWAGSGYAIYAIERSLQFHRNRLVRLAIDPQSGTLIGEPEILLTGLPFVLGVSASADGRKLMLCQWEQYMNLWKLGLPVSESAPWWGGEQLTRGTGYVNHPAISPDQRLISYSVSLSSGTYVCMRPLEGDNATQLTHGNNQSWISQWSPDGSQLALLGTNEAYDSTWVAVVSSDGSHMRKLLVMKGALDLEISQWLDWSGNNRIVLQLVDAERFLFLDPETGDTTLLGCELLSDDIRYPRLSPDGTRLAAVSYDPDGDVCEITVFSMTDSTKQDLIAVGGCLPDLLGWSPDGHWIRFMTCDKVLAKVNVKTRQVDTLVAFPERELRIYGSSPAVSPNESFVIYESGHRQSDMYMVEHFDPHAE
jgi:Tol biopolymer transport system component